MAAGRVEFAHIGRALVAVVTLLSSRAAFGNVIAQVKHSVAQLTAWAVRVLGTLVGLTLALVTKVLVDASGQRNCVAFAVGAARFGGAGGVSTRLPHVALRLTADGRSGHVVWRQFCTSFDRRGLWGLRSVHRNRRF